MTDYELFQVFAAQLEVVDRLFEFWITGTFAVILAAHFVGHSLTRGMRYLIAGLYFGLAALLLFRYVSAAAEAAVIVLELADKGVVRSRFRGHFREITITLRVILFVVGTSGALYYLLRRQKSPS